MNGSATRQGDAPGRDDARTRILDAARVAFAAHGYGGASLRSIAATAGVDVALTAYYFGNKHALYREVTSVIEGATTELADVMTRHRPEAGVRSTRVISESLHDEASRLAILSVVRTLFTPAGAGDPVHADVVDRTREFYAYAWSNPGTELADQAFAAMITGMFLAREVLGQDPIASADHIRLGKVLALQLQEIVDHPADIQPGHGTGPAAGRADAPGWAPSSFAGMAAGVDGRRDMRVRILDAARRSFATLGYHGTALRALADEVGCNVALIPYHYGNKARLFRAVVEQGLESAATLRPVAELDGGRAEDEAHDLTRAILDLFLDEPVASAVRAILLTAAAPRDGHEDLRRELLVRMQTMSDRVLGLDDAHGGTGVTRTPDATLGYQIFGCMFMGVYVLRSILKVEPLASATKEELVALLAPRLEWLLVGGLERALAPCRG